MRSIGADFKNLALDAVKRGIGRLTFALRLRLALEKRKGGWLLVLVPMEPEPIGGGDWTLNCLLAVGFVEDGILAATGASVKFAELVDDVPLRAKHGHQPPCGLCWTAVAPDAPAPNTRWRSRSRKRSKRNRC